MSEHIVNRVAHASKKKPHCNDCAYLDAWLDYVYDGEMCWKYECSVSDDGRCRPSKCKRFKRKEGGDD